MLLIHSPCSKRSFVHWSFGHEGIVTWRLPVQDKNGSQLEEVTLQPRRMALRQTLPFVQRPGAFRRVMRPVLAHNCTISSIEAVAGSSDAKIPVPSRP